MSSQAGWVSEHIRSQHSLAVRDLLRQCLSSELDVLLPKLSGGGRVELFFVVAGTDEIGGEAIARRIRQQLDHCSYVQQAGLTLMTSYQSIETPLLDAPESMQEFRQRAASVIQKLMDGEISSRMVTNGSHENSYR